MYTRLLALSLIICLMIALPVSAAEVPVESRPDCSELKTGNNVISTSSILCQVESVHEDTTEPRMVDPVTITVYENEYTPGTLKYYGPWRDGVSGGNDLREQEIYINHGNDTTLDISFTAAVSGEYTFANGTTIGLDLGVTLGKSKNYSLGSGTSVTVPKGSHWLIQYRPVYYVWTVTERTYQEVYRNGYLLSRHLISTKISYVDVFSYWDFRVIDDPLPELMNQPAVPPGSL